MNKIEIIVKNQNINAIQYDDEYDILFYSTEEGKLELYSTENGRGVKQYMTLQYEDCFITSLKLNKQSEILLVGTSKGSIRVFNWPLISVTQA